MGIFKSFKKILKKAAPIIGGTIGFAMGGPLGGSLFAGLGTGIGSLVAGADPDDALRNALIGKLGNTKVVNINDNNPFGIILEDPNGRDDILIESDVIHLKNNKPVKILLRSIDVLHNWYVPQFRSKMDAVPGIVTFYWFEPNKIGEYEVLCAEYCGVGHYAMRGTVIVQDEKNYNQWLSEQETFSEFVAKQNIIDIKE